MKNPIDIKTFCTKQIDAIEKKIMYLDKRIKRIQKELDKKDFTNSVEHNQLFDLQTILYNFRKTIWNYRDGRN